jgi:predicted ATPase/DNA-binding CsgD family transcriptional regulator
MSGALPTPLTSFIGRAGELELAQALLRTPERRLLTLTGPGGIGKTRLAIEIGSRLRGDYADGVCFVSLASVQHHSMVMPAIAAALGLRELDSESAPAAVAATLGHSNCLLIIDNVEHVLESAPGLTELLARCPHIQILATSRGLLRVEGEHAIPVPSLPSPTSANELTFDELLRVPVIRLFIDRARAIDPGHPWNQQEVAELVDICNRLDGLPLAIELAATKIRHLTLPEIRRRLDERLPLLIDGSRDHPNRLRTMRNAIGWSYDLLSPSEQTVFRRLAIFAGGFSLDAIEAISAQLTARDPVAAPNAESETASVQEQLSLLIDASLLLHESDPTGATRYRMLETIREFAGAQLAASGEQTEARDAHARYFTGFAESFEFADLMPSAARALDRLAIERANLQVALSWLEQAADTEHFLRLVAAHGNVWASTANYHEARVWYERALAAGAGDRSNHRAKIQVLLAMIELLQGEISTSDALFADGLAACGQHDEPYYTAYALLGAATAAILQDERERSAGLLEECRLVADRIPDRRLAEIVRGLVSLNLAVVARASGNLELAAAQLTDMLHRSKTEDYQLGVLLALGDLGDLARDRGEWNRALAFYREALVLGRAQPVKRVLIEVIESIAIVAARTGQIDRSAPLLGGAAGLRERTGLRYRHPENRSSLALAIEVSRAALGGDDFATCWQRGRTLPAERIVALALDMPDSSPPSTHALLTPREIEVARLLAQGMTDPEIAAALFISVRTVENHVAHMLAKLGVHTRTAAVSAITASDLLPRS